MHWNVILIISNKIHFNINYNKQLAVHCLIANKTLAYRYTKKLLNIIL